MKWYECPNYKNGCMEHKSCVDARKSTEKSKNHIRGKYCKNNNICSKCCSLKNAMRVIKHFVMPGNCSRKCEVCYSLREGHYWKKDGEVLKQVFLLPAIATILREFLGEHYPITRK